MSVHAPLRLLIAAASALLVAAVIASSSAHAMLLGDAVPRSAAGAPLRAVIPLGPSPGEAVEVACFKLIPAAGGGASIVTARVSLERAAATPRLIVTTASPVAEPVLRFAIENSCGGTTRRNYSLVLDPRAGVAPARSFAIAGNGAAGTREPGQERLKPAPAAANAAKVPLETTRATPAVAEKTADAKAVRNEKIAIASPASTRPTPSTQRPDGAGNDDFAISWYLVAPIAMGLIVLSVMFATRRRLPAMPDWTRGGALTGPRSYTDMSAQPVTLSRFDPTPMPKLSTTQRPDGASLRFVKAGIAANTLRRKTASDPSTLDTLINETEADRLEDRAIREAWAAARRDVEKDEDNAILKAIDEAERELLFVPPSPPSSDEAAMDRSLDDDLGSHPKRQKKAAA